MQGKSRQRGAVSLFIVLFSTLLIIIVVTAFIRTMIIGQQQATSNDLAKSALDSAYAGVEDAKRAIAKYYKDDCESSHPLLSCSRIKAALGVDLPGGSWSPDCDATDKAGVATLDRDSKEFKVKSTSNDVNLNQAYTCVKVQMYPLDYTGTLKQNVSRMIHLVPKSGSSFTALRVKWYMRADNRQINLITSPGSGDFPTNWGNRPPVLRLQLLQLADNMHLDAFDSNADYNSTLFLLPLKPISPLSPPRIDRAGFPFGLVRQSPAQPSIAYVKCDPNPASGSYACQVDITIPNIANKKSTYLNIAPYYSTIDTAFSISMLDTAGGSEIPTAMQPVVDSTGRADIVFRRVRSRIDIGSSILPLPVAAVDVTKSLCKLFVVADRDVYKNDSDSVCTGLEPTGAK